MTNRFFSPGKLLITAEYFVLHGAKALALPTRFGQSLKAEVAEKEISWESIDHKNNVWFSASFESVWGTTIESTDDDVADKLQKLLRFCLENNHRLRRGWKFSSSLDFDQNWGLGSSSTLVANLAKWSSTDPYELLKSAFAGSGYDVAVGIHHSALIYSLAADNTPRYEKVNWIPKFSDSIFFVYTGRKQSSESEVNKSISNKPSAQLIEDVNGITADILRTNSLLEFRTLIDRHEVLVSDYLGRETIKNERFEDFKGSIKSLGAWGGDFVLATGSADEMEYFRERGLSTVIPFTEMIYI